MDWDKLRIFKAVAEAGSFTHAGEILNLSQSAISRQISSLESSLGLPLFHRHARGLVLTEQGEMLLETTADVFNKLQKVEMQLSDSRALPEGSLTITTVEFIASTWLAPQISDFKRTYPDIKLTMLLDDRIYDLSRRDADVALRLYKSDHNDLIERHMTTMGFSLCASKEYLKTHGCPTTAKDFKNHIMIGYPRNVHTPFSKPNWIFKQLNINIMDDPNVILLNSMHARYTAVKNGTGISVLPHYIVHQDDDLEVLMPEIEIPTVDLFFVYPQERRNSKRISVFKDFLFESLKEMGGEL